MIAYNESRVIERRCTDGLHGTDMADVPASSERVFFIEGVMNGGMSDSSRGRFDVGVNMLTSGWS